MSVLEDGTYTAVVVDVSAGEDGTVALDLAIASGAHKGDIVRVIDHAPVGSPLDRLGLPSTLTVDGGEPVVTFDA